MANFGTVGTCTGGAQTFVWPTMTRTSSSTTSSKGGGARPWTMTGWLLPWLTALGPLVAAWRGR